MEAAGGVVVLVAIGKRGREAGNSSDGAHGCYVLHTADITLHIFDNFGMIMIGCRGRKHEAGEIVAAQSLHGIVNAIEQVKHGQGIIYAWVPVAVSGNGTGYNMEAHS